MRNALWMAAALAAGGGPGGTVDSGPRDAGPDAPAIVLCARPEDCGTAPPCTTVLCEPGNPAADPRGCMMQAQCTAGQRCGPAGVCVRDCTEAELDVDNDGDPSLECGGSDCDDGDRDRSGRRTEVCDELGVDEDCNPNTIRNPSDPADGDADRDELASYACFNRRADGTENRGPDCDDAVPGPGLGTRDSCSACGDACTLGCFDGACERAVDVSVGSNFACLVTDNPGRLICWGSNNGGQLADGSMTNSSTPLVALPPLHQSATSVFAGLNAPQTNLSAAPHACAFVGAATSSGSRDLYCWGGNAQGQLGVGNTTNPLPPQRVSRYSVVSAGYTATCAITPPAGPDPSFLYCWGANSNGRLGVGDMNARLTPTQVLAGVRDVSISSTHVCAVRDDGSVTCWGRNDCGQLGSGPFGSNRLAPGTSVPSLTNVVDLSVGANLSCAVLSDRTVRCWGLNPNGELGDGVASHGQSCLDPAMDYSATPVTVAGIGDAIQVETNGSRTCVLRASGRVACWGTGMLGQLGDGLGADRYTALDIPSLEDVVKISARSAYACAIRSDGEVLCWGANGALTSVPVLRPTPIPRLP
ncbi:MAG: hypothetical protein IT378_14330 [Sandaracinaceae bacterium]|nr:hypothetical protein [Sandaracinaceae bacterium]